MIKKKLAVIILLIRLKLIDFALKILYILSRSLDQDGKLSGIRFIISDKISLILYKRNEIWHKWCTKWHNPC